MNSTYRKLRAIRSMLDFVEEPPRDQTYGVAFVLLVVGTVKERAFKQPGPMDGELQRKVSHVCS